MPGIPLTTQTHSWVSGESRMGKNKVSFNREQCRAWETRWLCFPPTDEPVPQARSSHFQNTMDVEANVEASLGGFVYTPYHPSLYSKNTDLFMAEADSTHLMALRHKHHYSALSPSNHIRVNTPAAYSSKSDTTSRHAFTWAVDMASTSTRPIIFLHTFS